MGVIGNKGAVSCRLKVHDSYLCFVCAHFVPHRNNVEGRNANFHTIMEKTRFAGIENDISLNANAATPARLQALPPSRVIDHEMVFFIGDLNYRISGEVEIDEVFEKCADLDWPFLMGHDQLTLECQADRVFNHFQEGEIGFQPTYKFEPGTDNYEAREGKKRRAPSWCDRILWLTSKHDRVSLTSYRSSMVQRISDHKPVCAFFDTNIRRVDISKATVVLNEVVRNLDRWENEAQPRMELSGSDLSLGDVHYGQVWLLAFCDENVE